MTLGEPRHWEPFLSVTSKDHTQKDNSWLQVTANANWQPPCTEANLQEHGFVLGGQYREGYAQLSHSDKRCQVGSRKDSANPAHHESLHVGSRAAHTGPGHTHCAHWLLTPEMSVHLLPSWPICHCNAQTKFVFEKKQETLAATKWGAILQNSRMMLRTVPRCRRVVWQHGCTLCPLPCVSPGITNALHETERGIEGGVKRGMCCHLCSSQMKDLVHWKSSCQYDQHNKQKKKIGVRKGDQLIGD